MSLEPLKHETIVITGGTSGLGFAAAQRLMRDWPDLHVALLDMKEGRIEELHAELAQNGANSGKPMSPITNQFKTLSLALLPGAESSLG